jgi:hypothetical protein
MQIDVRREQSYIWRQYNAYGRIMGEDVLWLKFDTEKSRWDDMYDEAGLTYHKPIRVPVLWIDQIEDPEQYSGEGRRPTQRFRCAVSSLTLRQRGIGTTEAHGQGPSYPDRPSAPVPAQYGRPTNTWFDDRLNDLVYFDSRLYAISNFQIRGRTPQGDVIVGVSGLEMQPDEFLTDSFPELWEPIAGAP